MNLLLSCIGKRGYIADYLRAHLQPGERIVGTSNTPWTPGFAACDAGLLLPPISSDEYVPAVLDACRRREITGLLSFYDPDVVRLADHLDKLRAVGVTPLLPGPRAARDAFDKWRTFQVLRAAGIAVPDTTIDLVDALERLKRGELRFPLVVKPREGFGSADVYVAHDELQLRAFFSIAPGMLIQACVEGEMHDIEVLADPEGRVLEVTAWRKLASRIGETEQAITDDAPDLLGLGARLARAIGLVGPMDVDLFRTPDGALMVLELNLRFGGGYPVSHLAGADFPGLIVDVFRGKRPEPVAGRFRPGVALPKGLQVMGGPVEPFLAELRSGLIGGSLDNVARTGDASRRLMPEGTT